MLFTFNVTPTTKTKTESLFRKERQKYQNCLFQKGVTKKNERKIQSSAPKRNIHLREKNSNYKIHINFIAKTNIFKALQTIHTHTEHTRKWSTQLTNEEQKKQPKYDTNNQI